MLFSKISIVFQNVEPFERNGEYQADSVSDTDEECFCSQEALANDEIVAKKCQMGTKPRLA